MEQNHPGKLLEISWKNDLTLDLNEILSPELPKLVDFFLNRLRRAKLDWILEPIPKIFRLRRAEYLLT